MRKEETSALYQHKQQFISLWPKESTKVILQLNGSFSIHKSAVGLYDFSIIEQSARLLLLKTAKFTTPLKAGN